MPVKAFEEPPIEEDIVIVPIICDNRAVQKKSQFALKQDQKLKNIKQAYEQIPLKALSLKRSVVQMSSVELASGTLSAQSMHRGIFLAGAESGSDHSRVSCCTLPKQILSSLARQLEEGHSEDTPGVDRRVLSNRIFCIEPSKP